MIFIYLFNRLLRRIKKFFRHWYVNGFFVYSHFIVSFLEKLDRFFALKITWRYLFQPLYQERNIIGYILGFVFRLGRLLVGGAVYLAIIAGAAGLYLIWLAFPVYVIFKIIR
ncbi:MAG: hypothetical protein M1170_02600 [Patescibacteria group bacterium]|nr:hypothetical protein [Patescibacteria group bacterium]